MTSGQPTRSFTRLVAAIVVAALVIGAAILASSYLGTATTRTQVVTATASATKTDTMTMTNTQTTPVSTTSSSSTAPSQTSTGTTRSGECPRITFSYVVLNLRVESSSPTLICLRFYYYNSTAPITLNLTSILSIQGEKFFYSDGVNQSHSFNSASNFTVATSQSQLVIGGPTDENEGANVTYAFTAKSGASGTYSLAILSTGSPETWMVGPQEPLDCGYSFLLMTGDGQPEYTLPTYCATISTASISIPGVTTTTSSSPEYNIIIPGMLYPLTYGDTYFLIVGATNSIGPLE